MDSNQSSKEPLRYVASFRDLEVYCRQQTLARELFRLSKQFPKDEQFSLTSQLRRSSRSIGAQIAEAWAKRLYPKHFISKLTDADGEQAETQHWIIVACDCEYIVAADAKRLLGLCAEIGRMLGSMIRKADSFSSGSYAVREDSPDRLGDEELLKTDYSQTDY